MLGVDKLKKRYKAFEQKRALLAEYDVFMVDDRVIKIVAECLGKTFYKSKSKRPIPVRLTAGAYIDKTTRYSKGDRVGSSLDLPEHEPIRQHLYQDRQPFHDFSADR